MDFNLFTKKNSDHMLHEAYKEEMKRAKRRIYERVIAFSLAILACYLLGVFK